MTRDEMIKKLAVLRAEAEKKAEEYNALQMDGKFHEMVEVEETINEKIGEYTNIARTIAFAVCTESDDPMKKACELLTYPTIRVKDEPIEDSKMKTRTIIDAEKQIDLQKLHKHVKGGIGHDKEWIYAVEKMNFLMAAQKAKDLGIDPTELNNSYSMSEISKQYDLGKNPASKTNLLKTLTTIVNMMLGDGYKPVSHDVNYLISIYSKKNRKALTVTVANHRFMRNYIQEICHRIITGKTYEIDYKKKK